MHTDLVFFESELARYRDHLTQLQDMDESFDSSHVLEMESNL